MEDNRSCDAFVALGEGGEHFRRGGRRRYERRLFRAGGRVPIIWAPIRYHAVERFRESK